MDSEAIVGVPIPQTSPVVPSVPLPTKTLYDIFEDIEAEKEWVVDTNNYRKGRYSDDEMQYIRALCKEFNDETLGIIPDTPLVVFLAFSLNRSRGIMGCSLRTNCIYSALFKGLIRDQRVTSRL